METIIRSPALSRETRQLKRPDGRHEGVSSPFAAPPAAAAEPTAALQRTIHADPVTCEKEAPTNAVNRNAYLLIEQELANARMQIEQELTDARVKIEQETAALRAAAEREGFAKGMEKAEQAARQAVAEQVGRLESIMTALSQARDSVLDGAEDAIVEIAYTAVCRIIGETATTRVAVSGMVGQVLAGFKERDKLVVRLNPQDAELLQQVQEAPDECGAALRADASIRIGGCIVESGNGFLDARIETQLERFGEALLSARRNRDDFGEAL